MSRKQFNGRGPRAAFTFTTAVGGAIATAALGMGAANAAPFVDPYGPNDAYAELFGAAGTQGADNHLLDVNAALANPAEYQIFVNDVHAFEEAPFEHGISNLINAIDPSAFYEQTTAGVTGTIAESGGAYLVPDDALGYLATGLDYGLLTPTGLNYVLTPLIDILLGEPPAGAAAAAVDTPYVDTYAPGDAYTTLFGAEGAQGAANHLFDVNAALANPEQYQIFYNDVVAFEEAPFEHGLTNLINAIDPSAFYEQVSTGITGTIADSGGAYLVPDDFLGYLATGLDYGLLTPTGLNFVLTPLIDILLGEAPASVASAI
ncbi:hypothetical protein [Mycobacterium paraterrae]|uniref:PE-PGRS family protein n=1 Tax=Mycobacterium paraterrae TaxID=577492 RepID=A0ABY3VFB3_9MYCO|nr:hypothetical protein [Mycobacterium paraterrae]UMB67963.1 hypothetical protein MKK62_15940 [Mycobacterium paraterrae]